MLGFGIALASLPLAVEQLGYSPFYGGLVVSVWALTYVVTGVPAGAVLDSSNLKGAIPAAMAANGLIGLFFIFGRSLPFFLIGRLLQGIFESFVWTGINGLI